MPFERQRSEARKAKGDLSGRHGKWEAKMAEIRWRRGSLRVLVALWIAYAALSWGLAGYKLANPDPREEIWRITKPASNKVWEVIIAPERQLPDGYEVVKADIRKRFGHDIKIEKLGKRSIWSLSHYGPDTFFFAVVGPVALGLALVSFWLLGSWIYFGFRPTERRS